MTTSMRALLWIVFACLVLPWLNSRAAGPSSSIEPWIVSALCGALAYGLLRPRAPHGAVGVLLAGFAACILVRSGLAPETVAAAGACLLVFIAAAVGAAGAADPSLLRAVSLAWLAAALASTLIALLQYFGAADLLAPWVSTTGAGEAFANLRQRNQFASLTVIGMAALFWLVPHRLRLSHAMAAMAWLAIGNAATTSRTGLMEMVVLAALALAWPGRSRERTVLWLGGLAVYAVAAIVLPLLLDAATGAPGHRLWERVAAVDSCSSRRVLWSNVLHLIAQKPGLGWGWGELDYAHYFTLYDGARFCDILDNAHNLPLQLAVELGVPVAVVSCGVLATLALRAKPWTEADAMRQMAWAVLAVIALHSMLEYPLWYGPFQLAAGLAVGLLARRGGAEARETASPWAGALAFAAMAACAYAAWDYRRVSQIYLPAEARAQAYRDDPLPQVRRSWLFRPQARFAEVTVTPLTLQNKEWMLDNSLALLHYSPEPRVIEKVIESASLTDRGDVAVGHLARLRAAFPAAYAEWSKAKR